LQKKVAPPTNRFLLGLDSKWIAVSRGPDVFIPVPGNVLPQQRTFCVATHVVQTFYQSLWYFGRVIGSNEKENNVAKPTRIYDTHFVIDRMEHGRPASKEPDLNGTHDP
jgi:hypothetical protein